MTDESVPRDPDVAALRVEAAEEARLSRKCDCCDRKIGKETHRERADFLERIAARLASSPPVPGAPAPEKEERT